MTGAWRERRLAGMAETTETGSSLPLQQTMTTRLEECSLDRSSPSYKLLLAMSETRHSELEPRVDRSINKTVASVSEIICVAWRGMRIVPAPAPRSTHRHQR